MLQVSIVVDDNGQMQLRSTVPNRIALADLLAQAISSVMRDEGASRMQESKSKIVTAPAGALNALPGAKG